MKYTAEQIKPKRYPIEVANNSGSMWIQRETDKEWINVGIERGYPCYKGILWFIDIPGAPPELKPLQYPQNKPSEDGVYWVHHVESNKWRRWHYIADSMLIQYSWDDGIVDYFIPIRLDKENEMDANKRLDKIEDVLTELQVFLNGEGILPGVHYFDNDVVKRDELLPCPNPECEGEISDIYTEQKENDYWVTYCDYCGLKAPMEYTREQSIKIWNALPRKGE